MARRMASAPRASNLAVTGNVQVKGLREYQDKLLQLGEGMVTKGCVAALAPAADLMRDAVRARTPVLQVPDVRRKPGTLRNAIRAMRVKTVGDMAVTFVIGIRNLSARAVTAFKKGSGRSGAENPNDPYYGTILEYGKTPRTRIPFLRPGFQASAEPAMQLAGRKLGDYTEAEIRRLGAKS